LSSIIREEKDQSLRLCVDY
jgi:hypothetical protein